jgi:hypothetical protein
MKNLIFVYFLFSFLCNDMYLLAPMTQLLSQFAPILYLMPRVASWCDTCIYLFRCILLQPLYIAWLLVYSCVTSNHLNLFLCMYLAQIFFFIILHTIFFCCNLPLFWLNLIYYIISLLIFFIMFCSTSNSNLSHYVAPLYFTFIPPTPLALFLFLFAHACLFITIVCFVNVIGIEFGENKESRCKRWFQFITKDNVVFKFGLRCKITIIIVFGGCCILNTFHERYAHELCEVENGSNPMICKVTFIFSSFDL